MSRIAIGGFQHETNTFAPSKADYAAFEAGGGWPGVQYGETIFGAVEGANIPAAGAIAALRALGHTMVGTAWGAASPSAHVTADAFERIAGELIKNLEKAKPVDGVYLDWGSDSARLIKRAGPRALDPADFAPGSMRPKLEAAIGFTAETGRPALIGRLEDATRILAGAAGTRIDAVTTGLVLSP